MTWTSQVRFLSGPPPHPAHAGTSTKDRTMVDSTGSRTLAPGIYNLVACNHESEPFLMSACLDPNGAHNDEDAEDDFACQPFYAAPAPITFLPGRPDVLVLRVDIGDIDIEGSSIQTPYGPLSISDHYVLVPTDRITRNAHPGEQYVENWLSFELTGEQPLSVDGSVIRIGGMEIDAAALGDVEHTEHQIDGEPFDWMEAVKKGRTKEVDHVRHVAKTGDRLHAILSEMPRELDDGVIAMLTFTPQQVADIECIWTPAADAFGREMRDQMRHGRSHIVLRPAIA